MGKANAPEEHARDRRAPLRQPTELAVHCRLEDVATRAIERRNFIRMSEEALIPPLLNNRQCDHLRQRRRLQVRRL